MRRRKIRWPALLQGRDRQAALARCRTLIERVEAADPQSNNLDRGRSGLVLLYHYAALVFPKGHYGDRRDEGVEALIEGLKASELDDSLHAGHAGVAWVLNHVIPRSQRTLLDSIDAMLLETIRSAPESFPFEFMHGWAGIGWYAVDRLPYRHGERLLRAVIDRAARTAIEPQPGRRAWFTKPQMTHDAWLNTVAPRGHFNLGFSHGVPGVLPVLAAAAMLLRSRQAHVLLKRAVSWLVGFRRTVEAGQSSYSGFAALNGRIPPFLSKVAWCYGDPGVGAALGWAASALGDDDLAQESLALIQRAAPTPRIKFDPPVDTLGLCHGAAGLAQLLLRAFVATSSSTYQDGALAWIKVLLRSKAQASCDFLEGNAGVALALMAAASEVEPGWDHVLAMS